MLKKSFTSKILVSFSISMLFPLVSFAAFSDTTESHPQFKAIETLQREGIVQGYSDGTFTPDKPITKAAFFKMLFQSVGYKPSTPGTYLTGYSDVPADSWFAPYIKKALELKLIPPGRTFSPEKYLSKLEALRLTFAVKGIPTPYETNLNPEDLFLDVDPHSPFAYLAAAAKRNGIISTENPEIFRAFSILTRAEAAELIYQTTFFENDTEHSEENFTEDSSVPFYINFDEMDETSAKFFQNPKFPILLDVWAKMHSEYYDKDKLNTEELMYGAIEGIISKIEDKYTVFESPTGAEALSNFLNGELNGIGVQIQLIDKQLVIVRTMEGSPAQKTGLLPGDIITHIDEKDIQNLSLEEILNLLRGKEGTLVEISILRQNAPQKLKVERQKLVFNSVESKMINNQIGYMYINQFIPTTLDDFERELEELLAYSPKAFILDLRGNPGGYINSATDILNHFIPEGKTLVSTKMTDGNISHFISKGPGELEKYPVIVLVDNQTASAAEIMAAALQEHGNAKLVGTKTFGKGSVQKLYSYPDTSLLKISIAHWLTPNGKDIHNQGLTPDISVERTKDDVLSGKDPQLERAILELQK